MDSPNTDRTTNKGFYSQEVSGTSRGLCRVFDSLLADSPMTQNCTAIDFSKQMSGEVPGHHGEAHVVLYTGTANMTVGLVSHRVSIRLVVVPITFPFSLTELKQLNSNGTKIPVSVRGIYKQVESQGCRQLKSVCGMLLGRKHAHTAYDLDSERFGWHSWSSIRSFRGGPSLSPEMGSDYFGQGFVKGHADRPCTFDWQVVMFIFYTICMKSCSSTDLCFWTVGWPSCWALASCACILRSRTGSASANDNLKDVVAGGSKASDHTNRRNNGCVVRWQY